MPPLTPSPAGEAQMLPDIEGKSNQHLAKYLMGTTKSQLRPELPITIFCPRLGLYKPLIVPGSTT